VDAAGCGAVEGVQVGAVNAGSILTIVFRVNVDHLGLVDL
jgi:hypothetical protein